MAHRSAHASDPLVWMAVPLVFGATLLAFWPAADNAFVSWDDYANLRDNPHVRGLGADQLRWMFTSLHFGHYQPVTWLTYALDHELSGGSLETVHRTNVLLHALNAAVFFCLARSLIVHVRPRLSARSRISIPAGALVAALVFALHPLRVESVAWATERRDLVSALFAMLAVLAYLRGGAAATPASRRRWMIACAVLFALGALGKVIVTLLPIVLLVLDAYPLQRRLVDRGVWLGKLPFFAVSLVIGLLGFGAVGEARALTSLHEHSLLERGLQFFYGLSFYAQKTLLPIGLTPLYALPDSLRLAEGRFAGAAIVSVAITVMLVRFRRRWPAGLAVWTCYVVWLLPVSGLVQNGPQITADRYSYLACLGYAVLIGAGVTHVLALNPRNGSLALFVGCVSCATLGVLSWRQTAFWRDSTALWQRVIEIEPDSAIAHNGMGAAILEDASNADPAERYRRAIPQFRRALELDPGHLMANFNLGVALHETGQLFEAELRLRQAVASNPSAEARAELGRLLVDLGRPAEAVVEYEAAMRLDSKRFEIVYGYGIALHGAGRYADAIVQYAVAETLRPRDVRVVVNRCLAHLSLGELDDATAALQRASRVAPNHPLVLDAQARLRQARERAQPLR